MTQLAVGGSVLPDRLQGLHALATNLSWSWNRPARELFRLIDPILWRITHHNPIILLQRVAPERLEACARDDDFLRTYEAVLAEIEREKTSHDTWYAQNFNPGSGPVAYFSAEFGLHNSVPIYSGGLGVLAGDHCKASSDLGVPLVAVGLFYTKGYFDQRLRIDGWQEDGDETFHPASTPLIPLRGPGDEPYLAMVRTDGREVHVGAWRMMVGRVPIYLLDTNLEVNDPADRELLNKLYAGGPGLRLRQEWILGAGGVRVLRAVGLQPVAWHANEGHAAFMMLERLREETESGLDFDEGLRRVRATTLFTTHTPVPAGHDMFGTAQVGDCLGPIWKAMGTTRDQIMGLGRHPELDGERFHMTVAAIRMSGRVNGVAQRHGTVSREMWQVLWPGRPVTDVPVGHVTNGVHLATWMSNPMMDLLDLHLGDGWGTRLDEPQFWDEVLSVDDERLWEVHLHLKARLLDFITEEARRRWRDDWPEATHLVGAGTLLSSEALTIGFARRFATYKRADLIFRDSARLRKLLVNPWRPVQIVFSGKAHPADEPGKHILKQVYEFTRDPRFEGRVAFLEDYNMHVAHRLVQGVDLWLNLPRVPLEACGTSGMKAALNAVPQLGTRDGWWEEGYTGDNGWQIGPPNEQTDVEASDAEQLYDLLEREIVPLYYQRDSRGIPTGWVAKMKQALRTAGDRFTARRMVQQYVRDHYLHLMGGQIVDDPPVSGCA